MAEIGTTYSPPKALRMHCQSLETRVRRDHQRDQAERSRAIAAERARHERAVRELEAAAVAPVLAAQAEPEPTLAVAFRVAPAQRQRRPYDADGNPLCVQCGTKVADRRNGPGRYPERCPDCRAQVGAR